MANVADTILEQLGGSRFISMTGASNLISDDNTLTFKIQKNEKRVTHVRVTLESDEYLMEFIRVLGGFTMIVAKRNVQVEQLRETFERETDLESVGLLVIPYRSTGTKGIWINEHRTVESSPRPGAIQTD